MNIKNNFIVGVSGKSNIRILDKIYRDSKNTSYDYTKIQKKAKDKLKKMGLDI